MRYFVLLLLLCPSVAQAGFLYETQYPPGYGLVSVQNARVYPYEYPYTSGQPISSWGPSEYKTEGELIYKFETGLSITHAEIFASVRIRGDNSYINIDISNNGSNWVNVGQNQELWNLDITNIVVGASDIWVRVKMYDEYGKYLFGPDGSRGGPRLPYTLIQFGKSFNGYYKTFSVSAEGGAMAVPEPSGYALMMMAAALMLISSLMINYNRKK